MSRTLAIGCGVICVGVLAGCGGSQRASGYLYRYGNGEAFIQWQRHREHIHGTWSTTQSCCVEGPARLMTSSVRLNGSISGKNVLFDSPHGETVSGTLHSYGLLLTSCPPCGVGVRYRRTSVADYNAAIAQTKATVQRMRKRQAAEQAAGP
jgi:hypothetical protein